MIYWIVISIVFGFCFGYFLGNWSAKDDEQNTKEEYKITTYSENLEHVVFNKEIKREDAYMGTDLIERIVTMDIAEQIRPYIKDKMTSEYDPYKMAAIYKFDLWVRR